MRTAIIKKVYNIHINDKYGVTISDKFIVYYVSGVVRTFKCRNKLSENAFHFIHSHDAKGSSITDKNQKTSIYTTWSKSE